MATPRVFTDAEAVREQTPVLVGLVSPSGAGKTYSALRLATGMQRVTGGEIFVVDTEQKRAKHYAAAFKFRHVPFGKPFSPLDYLAAIEHCVTKGAKIVIVDSMSHEHEGPGGVLEMHSAKLDKLAGDDWKKRERCTMLAWSEPKQQRRRLLNSIVQMDCNFIFCFRAKRKIKPVKGGEPLDLGWMPIGGEEFVYEMTMNAILHPGANGVPSWKPTEVGEREMVKLPEQFRDVFAGDPQLSEDIGEKLARWAAGGVARTPMTVAELVAAYAACSDDDTMAVLKVARGVAWPKLDKAARERVTVEATAAKERIDKAARARAAEAPATPPASEPALTLAPDGNELTEADRRAIALADREAAAG